MTITKMCVLSAALLFCAIAGCSDSGVSDSKKLTALTTAESKDVCLELAGDYPERTVMCGTTAITVGLTAAECNVDDPATATCTATVGDARDCVDALYSQTDAQLCADTPPPAACAKLQGC